MHPFPAAVCSAPCYWWELTMICRKMLIALVAVAFAKTPRSQGLAGLVVVFIFTILHGLFRPLSNHLMDRFELTSLFCSTISFFLGVLTQVHSSSLSHLVMCRVTVAYMFELVCFSLSCSIQHV